MRTDQLKVIKDMIAYRSPDKLQDFGRKDEEPESPTSVVHEHMPRSTNGSCELIKDPYDYYKFLKQKKEKDLFVE